MIHQNYKNAVFKVTDSNYAKHFYNISNIISESDKVGFYIFHQNEWDIGTYYAISSCYNVSNYIQSIRTRKKVEPDPILFTRLLNRTSLKCTYKHTYNKNIAKFNNYFVDKDIVKYNIGKMKALIAKDAEKYNYLLETNKIFDDKGQPCVKLLTKLDKCI